MDALPCQGCRGLCCGPVPVTNKELRAIRKLLGAMPRRRRIALEQQERFFGTCMFYDQDSDKCGIHSARPDVCRAFGHSSNLVCFRRPESATGSPWQASSDPAGILSVDFTWKDF
ncbi:YkgJ family cysteine cluster protein [Paenibacillus koleovorans]|uniref:YkgJ family cysteine cluster protein n=1 Tax=Paenibacillus koleovorans TaxID=121608 RepID=UPI000FDBD554|nr:YkgJ family cysteine cluster protein [Paenibacillus koleovorans]